MCHKLLQLIGAGMPNRKEDWPAELQQYHTYKNQLLVINGVVVCGERPLIPASLRAQALDILHAGHAGTSTMQTKAAHSLFWPGMTKEIEERRAMCRECTYRAPSQAAQPSQAPIIPEYPFSHICCDFFHLDGYTYLATCDRFSNWLSVSRFGKDDSKAVISFFKEYFARYGIAKELTTDGQKTLCSAEMEDFLARWGVRHRVSSAYHPQANKRAEVAVKQVKRLVEGNLGSKGQLDTERFARALLEHRNTPDPLTGLSPAMVVFGKKLRGFLPDSGQTNTNKEWRMDMEAREQAFAKRHSQMAERMDVTARQLQPLLRGTEVAIQDEKKGGKAGRWSKSGTIVECLSHDAYMVRIHGSRTVSKRNRIHLRKIHPLVPEEKLVPTVHPRVSEIPEQTKTEVSERFVAVQPPRQWIKLKPEEHRYVPAARPGEDAVGALRRRETRQLQGISKALWGNMDVWGRILAREE